MEEKLPGAGWKHRQEGTLAGGKPGRRCNRLKKVDQDDEDDDEHNTQVMIKVMLMAST